MTIDTSYHGLHLHRFPTPRADLTFRWVGGWGCRASRTRYRSREMTAFQLRIGPAMAILLWDWA
jgi:hypothetical protein